MKALSPEASAVQRRMLRYLRSGRVHPALLLVGPDRENKIAVVKAMAQQLLCQKPGETGACGRCSPCLRIAKDIHPDVLLMREEGEDTIKIDTVRDLCHQMEIGPLEAASKICILDECHRMSSSSANAFLKTLEEPGPGRHFWLLTTQPGSLLPTILSRCLQFTFKPESRATALPETEEAELRKLFQELQKSRSVFALMGAIGEKEKALHLVQFLQRQLHAAAIDGQGIFADRSPFECLATFDEAVKLEGRLRSNANYALMLETFLRKSFLSV